MIWSEGPDFSSVYSVIWGEGPDFSSVYCVIWGEGPDFYSVYCVIWCEGSDFSKFYCIHLLCHLFKKIIFIVSLFVFFVYRNILLLELNFKKKCLKIPPYILCTYIIGSVILFTRSHFMKPKFVKEHFSYNRF